MQAGATKSIICRSRECKELHEQRLQWHVAGRSTRKQLGAVLGQDGRSWGERAPATGGHPSKDREVALCSVRAVKSCGFKRTIGFEEQAIPSLDVHMFIFVHADEKTGTERWAG